MLDTPGAHGPIVAAEKKRSVKSDRSKPNEELEALRARLELEAEDAVRRLVTLNRPIQVKRDEEARIKLEYEEGIKAMRVVGAVLAMFRGPTLSDQGRDLLDRLFGVLEARDLTAQGRVLRAVEITDRHGREYLSAADDDARERCADDYVIWLATRVDPKWLALRDKLESCTAELARWRPLYEAKKRGTHNAFAILARLNQFVGVSGFGLKGSTHVERTQKAIETAHKRANPTT